MSNRNHVKNVCKLVNLLLPISYDLLYSSIISQMRNYNSSIILALSSVSKPADSF